MSSCLDQKLNDKKPLNAFTLAEVLITLGVIGVVAAMTIPTLMQNIQDAQFKSAWKKEYATFSQAYSQIINDNGGTIVGAFDHVGPVEDSRNLLTLFKDKMKTIQYCDSVSPTVFNCFYPTAVPSLAVHTKDGGTETFSGAGYPAMILGDGTLVKLIGSISGGWIVGSLNVYGQIILDINGRSGPNVIGRDIFGIWMLDTKLVPWGVQGDAWYQNTCNTSGYACSSDYLSQ